MHIKVISASTRIDKNNKTKGFRGKGRRAKHIKKIVINQEVTGLIRDRGHTLNAEEMDNSLQAFLQ